MKKVKVSLLWFNKRKGYGEVLLDNGSKALLIDDELKDDISHAFIKKAKENIGLLKKGEQFVYQSFSNKQEK